MIYQNILVMKRDDIILYKGCNRGIILDIIVNRCKVRLYDQYGINGYEMETWVPISDIKLDIKYYRGLKLKKFLKSTF